MLKGNKAVIAGYIFIEGGSSLPDKQGPWFLEKLLDGEQLSLLLSGTFIKLNAAVQ